MDENLTEFQKGYQKALEDMGKLDKLKNWVKKIQDETDFIIPRVIVEVENEKHD